MSLELYSSQELIKELFSRETFLGTLIYYDLDFKRLANTPTHLPKKGLKVITSGSIKKTKLPVILMRHTANYLENK